MVINTLKKAINKFRNKLKKDIINGKKFIKMIH